MYMYMHLYYCFKNIYSTCVVHILVVLKHAKFGVDMELKHTPLVSQECLKNRCSEIDSEAFWRYMYIVL